MTQTTGYAVVSESQSAGPFFVTNIGALFQLSHRRESAQGIADTLNEEAKKANHPLTYRVIEVSITPTAPIAALHG